MSGERNISNEALAFPKKNTTSTGQVFPVKSWSISYAPPDLHTQRDTNTHKHGCRPSDSVNVTPVDWARHPGLHSSNHIRQLYNTSHVLKYVINSLLKTIGTAYFNPVTSGSRRLCLLIKLLANSVCQEADHKRMVPQIKRM